MASLAQKGALATDNQFVTRVIVAMVNHALTVLGENPATVEGWPARGSLARLALYDRTEISKIFVMALATSDLIADKAYVGAFNSSNISDTAIVDAVAQVWNKVAGSTGA